MFRHKRSKAASKGAAPSSGSLFQGSTQSRERQQQFMGLMDAAAREMEVDAGVGGVGDAGGGDASGGDASGGVGDASGGGVGDAGAGGQTDDDQDVADVEARQTVSSSTIRFRKCNSVRARPAASDKLLIRPLGETSWDDVGWEGNKGPRTKINGVLGALCRYHYPGMVVVQGVPQPATLWAHWGLKREVMEDGSEGRSIQGVVWHDFWTRYRTDTDENDREAMRALKRHFNRSAEKVINDSLYNARITAVCHYYKSVKGEKMNKKMGANRIYLTEEEYLKTEVDWLMKDLEAWKMLAKMWSSPEWIENSESKRSNRGQDPGHKYGADGHFGLQRRMEAETGTSQSFMSVFLRGHRGPDPTNPDVLCSQAAKEKLDRYGQEMVKRHGEGVQWMKEPLDVEALYRSGEGRKHGRFSFGTGVVDYNRSVSRAGSSSLSTASSRRSRVEEAQEEAREAREEARQARQEARRTREESQKAMEYMSTWAQQLSASLGPDVNLPAFRPPVFTSQQGEQSPQPWTVPQGPQGFGGWPAWPATQASQMPPQGFQQPMGWMPQGPYWAPGPGPNYGPWIRPFPDTQVSGSRPDNATPNAEVDPNEYLRHSLGGSGSGHNSNNPQS